jgi:hypothetical protein
VGENGITLLSTSAQTPTPFFLLVMEQRVQVSQELSAAAANRRWGHGNAEMCVFCWCSYFFPVRVLQSDVLSTITCQMSVYITHPTTTNGHASLPLLPYPINFC